MARVRAKHVAEAEALLAELVAIPDAVIADLPPLYREHAREYRALVTETE
jgi:hypothetical protein